MIQPCNKGSAHFPIFLQPQPDFLGRGFYFLCHPMQRIPTEKRGNLIVSDDNARLPSPPYQLHTLVTPLLVLSPLPNCRFQKWLWKFDYCRRHGSFWRLPRDFRKMCWFTKGLGRRVGRYSLNSLNTQRGLQLTACRFLTNCVAEGVQCSISLRLGTTTTEDGSHTNAFSVLQRQKMGIWVKRGESKAHSDFSKIHPYRHRPATVYKVPICLRGNLLYNQIYSITEQNAISKGMLRLWNDYFISDFALYPVTT